MMWRAVISCRELSCQERASQTTIGSRVVGPEAPHHERPLLSDLGAIEYHLQQFTRHAAIIREKLNRVKFDQKRQRGKAARLPYQLDRRCLAGRAVNQGIGEPHRERLRQCGDRGPV